MKKTLLIILPLLLIVGCSKPVDESTLINKDGLMYLPDSDSPYSGEVFTNYDTGEKVYQGTYENGLLIEYSYLNKDGTVKDPINEDSVQTRGGLKYEINQTTPYSGPTITTYDNGKLSSKGNFKDGKWNGLWTYFHENGQKKGEGSFENGDGSDEGNTGIPRNGREGTWTFWYKNGQKKTEFTFKNGKNDGLITGWYENGNKMTEGTYKDGKIDGIVTEWYEIGRAHV